MLLKLNGCVCDGDAAGVQEVGGCNGRHPHRERDCSGLQPRVPSHPSIHPLRAVCTHPHTCCPQALREERDGDSIDEERLLVVMKGITASETCLEKLQKQRAELEVPPLI